MNSINTKGIYQITATPGKILNLPDEAILLKLDANELKYFKLKDLLDLQSKLVLVAAENADNVNKFIEVSLKELLFI